MDIMSRDLSLRTRACGVVFSIMQQAVVRWRARCRSNRRKFVDESYPAESRK